MLYVEASVLTKLYWIISSKFICNEWINEWIIIIKWINQIYQMNNIKKWYIKYEHIVLKNKIYWNFIIKYKLLLRLLRDEK